MKFNEFRILMCSLLPILAGALRRGQLFRPAAVLTEPDADILCEYDVRIPMSEGFFLTANVFRSKSAAARDERVPVVMCAHPYDNSLIPALKKTPLSGPPKQYRMIRQCGGRPVFSTLTGWEAPDPDFWVRHGYAVVNLNLPGYGSSEGPPSVFSKHQSRCYGEAIDWIAAQSWCDGKVGLSGVSFLAISQYYVASKTASTPPAALKCIAPWEGISDPYRDLLMNGGIQEVGFPVFWWQTEMSETIRGGERAIVETEGGLPRAWTEMHLFLDENWKAKIPDLESIELPMLVGASFSDHSLHTMGTLRAFERARSKQKWLYTHRTGKWVAYYSDEVKQLTLDFMDCFLKGKKDRFESRPRVTLEVRSSRDTIHEKRFENEWPLAHTQYRPLYLEKSSLTPTAPTTRQEIGFDSRSETLRLHHTFDVDTELSGYFALKLFVESRGTDDGDLFVILHKIDARGRIVYFNGSVGLIHDGVSRGCLRLSRRELDLNKSTPFHPVLSGTSHQPLRPDEIVPVEIAMLPSATFFKKGEALLLLISGREIIPAPPFQRRVSGKRGRTIIHTGGPFDSHLLIPVIPSARAGRAE